MRHVNLRMAFNYCGAGQQGHVRDNVKLAQNVAQHSPPWYYTRLIKKQTNVRDDVKYSEKDWIKCPKSPQPIIEVTDSPLPSFTKSPGRL